MPVDVEHVDSAGVPVPMWERPGACVAGDSAGDEKSGQVGFKGAVVIEISGGGKDSRLGATGVIATRVVAHHAVPEADFVIAGPHVGIAVGLHVGVGGGTNPDFADTGEIERLVDDRLNAGVDLGAGIDGAIPGVVANTVENGGQAVPLGIGAGVAWAFMSKSHAEGVVGECADADGFGIGPIAGDGIAGVGPAIAVIVSVHGAGEADLAEIAAALDEHGSAPGPAQGGEEDANQQSDNADDDQQFDERESGSGVSTFGGGGGHGFCSGLVVGGSAGSWGGRILSGGSLRLSRKAFKSA